MVKSDSNLEIRPAHADDVAAITRIYAHAVRHGVASFELEPPDEAEIAKRLQAVLATGYPYLVAELDGQVVGYAYAGPYRSRPAYRWSVENSVYVDPDYNKRGLGRTLLLALITATEERGFRQMIAVIGGSDHVASIELHKQLGFEVIGTLRGVGMKHGAWRDSVLLQRPLGAGETTLPGGLPSDR